MEAIRCIDRNNEAYQTSQSKNIEVCWQMVSITSGIAASNPRLEYITSVNGYIISRLFCFALYVC